MERKKFINQQDTKEELLIDTNEEPIVVSKHLMDLLLGQPNFFELCGLYMFYYYTAKWQRTNRPYCTNSYVASRLSLNIKTVEKYKANLIKLHLIENVTEKGGNGSIIKHYIKVNFIWAKTTINDTTSPKNHLPKFWGTDALSTNNKRVPLNFIKYFPMKFQKDEGFKTAINEFVTHRKEKGKLLTKLSCNKLANKLMEYSIPVCIKALGASVENGWTGVFPESIKEKDKQPPNYKASQFKPEYKYNGDIRYKLNPDDGEYYHKNGDKYVS